MMPDRRRKTKESGSKGSTFVEYTVALPETLEAPARHRGPKILGSAEALAIEEGPLSVRSATMIDQMRQSLKMAIRELRGDMSQTAFAKQIGIRQTALARMESLNNEVFPSTPLLIRIALVSGRDLQVSFVRRTEDALGVDMITAETAGFSTSAGSHDYRVVIHGRLRDMKVGDDTQSIRPLIATIEEA